ncbi:MAG: ATP-grasp domain-containing protein [Pirellulales bacterium]|nr:ATP-grasp domain-containing protein [Pirellulales bacterium]
MDVNILFTSVGRRVELLRSFREAYAELGLSGRIVATDIDPLAPGLRLADSPYLVPGLHSPDFVPALEEILRREHVSVVFPLIDPDIFVLAAHRERLENTGARLAVVETEAAGLTADKWLTTSFFNRLGLPTARSWLPGDHELEELAYPLFIKPRSGSASHHTFRVDTPQQLAFFSEYITDPIIQEFLAGPEITSDVICDLEGELLAVVSRQRIRTQGGEVIVGKTIYDQTILDSCARIARSLPAVGPITVQCMMNRGQAVFTEINARFGGGAPLGIAAGANSPKWLLAQAAGMPCDVPALGTYRRGFCVSRYHESLFVDEAEAETALGVAKANVPAETKPAVNRSPQNATDYGGEV